MFLFAVILATTARAREALPGLAEFRGEAESSSSSSCPAGDPTCRVVCQDLAWKQKSTGARCLDVELWGAGRRRPGGGGGMKYFGTAPWADRLARARAAVDPRTSTSAADACCFFGGGRELVVREARPLFDAQVDVKAARKVVPATCGAFLATTFSSIGDLVAEAGGPAVGHVGDGGGYWTACTHLDIYGLNFAAFLARHLAYGLRPRSVLEFGCGLGTTSDFLARHVPGGSAVVCLEPSPMLGEVFAAANRVHPQRPYQLAVDVFDEGATDCARDLFARKVDLVLSLEVAEHLSPDRLEPLAKYLASATGKYLVFAAARPRQGGTGHIEGSMKTREWWREKFESHGLKFLPMLTKRLRWAARPDREYDLGFNIIAMGAPGVPDRSDVPREAGGGCASYEHKFCTNQGNTVAAAWTKEEKAEENARSQDRRGALRDGQAAALWPELHAVERALRSGEASCVGGRPSS